MRHRLLSLVFSVLAVSVLTLAYWKVAQAGPLDSDNATLFRAASDVLHGNLLLRGWTTSGFFPFATELPLYVAGIACCGATPALLRWIPALLYALVVILAVFCAADRDGRLSRTTVALVAVLLVAPAPLAARLVLSAYFHVSTLLLLTLCFLLIAALDRSPACGRRFWAVTSLYALLMLLAIAQDGLALWTAGLAVVLVSTVRAGAGWGLERKKDLALAAATVFAAAGAKALLDLIRAAHGFEIGALSPSFVDISALAAQCRLAVTALLGLYHADFFGRRLNVSVLPLLLGLIGVSFVLSALSRTLTRPDRLSGPERLPVILAAAMIADMLAFVFSNLPEGPLSARYLLPFFLCGAILAGRQNVQPLLHPTRFRAALACLALASAGSFIHRLSVPAVTPPAAALAAFLASRGLHYGYGAYWSASIATVESRGGVQIAPVEADAGRIVRRRWMSCEKWYTGPGGNFLVCDPGTDPGVNYQAATLTFGKPDEVQTVGKYPVFIWHKRILPGSAP